MERATKTKRKKPKDTGWKDIYGGQAFVIPLALLKHDNFRRISPYACKLLFDLGQQYNGSNNGYLHPGIKIMKPLGWRSRSTLHDTIQELLHYRLIVQTAQGGRNKPSYYGFTFRSIVEKPNRPFDCPIPIVQPSDAWNRELPAFEKKSLVQVVDKVSPPDGQVKSEFVHDVDKLASTCPPDGQVDTVSEGQFVHHVDTYKHLLPYPYPNAAAPGFALGSALAPDSSCLEGSDVIGRKTTTIEPAFGSDSLALKSLKKNGPNQIEGNLALAEVALDSEGFL